MWDTKFIKHNKAKKLGEYPSFLQTADKVKVSGQIFCKKPFQITRNMV